jgi:hypothetical protein
MVVVSVIVAISASATITIVVLIVPKLAVIRIESLISKEGGFAINLLLLLLICGNRGL